MILASSCEKSDTFYDCFISNFTDYQKTTIEAMMELNVEILEYNFPNIQGKVELLKQWPRKVIEDRSYDLKISNKHKDLFLTLYADLVESGFNNEFRDWTKNGSVNWNGLHFVAQKNCLKAQNDTIKFITDYIQTYEGLGDLLPNGPISYMANFNEDEIGIEIKMLEYHYFTEIFLGYMVKKFVA